MSQGIQNLQIQCSQYFVSWKYNSLTLNHKWQTYKHKPKVIIYKKKLWKAYRCIKLIIYRIESSDVFMCLKNKAGYVTKVISLTIKMYLNKIRNK